MFFIPLMSTTSQDRWLHVKQEEQETMLVDRVIQQARTWEIYVINGPNGLKLFNKPWMGHLMLTCILIGGVPCSTNILKALTIILKVNLMKWLPIFERPEMGEQKRKRSAQRRPYQHLLEVRIHLRVLQCHCWQPKLNQWSQSQRQGFKTKFVQYYFVPFNICCKQYL